MFIVSDNKYISHASVIRDCFFRNVFFILAKDEKK